METKDYNQIDWKSFLDYSEDSPTGVTNKRGRPVGSVHGKKGYRYCLGPGNNWWYVHRIVYVLKHGSIDPSLYVDHIDGNVFNNKIHNLRLVTTQINNKNKGTYSKSFVFGVGWQETDGYLFAYARLGTKGRKTELFSVTKLGIMEAWKRACIRRRELLEADSEYTERHKQ